MTPTELAQSLTMPGPTLAESDLLHAEQRWGFALPHDYREFLRSRNGGILDARFAAMGFFPDRLYGLRHDDDHLSLWTAIDRHTELMKRGMLPIADEHSGNVLCLRVDGPNIGTLWVKNDDELQQIAPTFAAFVAALTETESPLDEVLYEQGLSSFGTQSFELAHDCFQQSWSLSNHAMTAYRIGETLVQLARHHESHIWFARAYQLNPRNSMIATAYATDLHRQGLYQEARDVVHTVLKSTPTYGPAKKLLATLQ